LSCVRFDILTIQNDWATRYESSYYASCNNYSNVIIGQIYGHHSKELTRSINDSIGGVVTVGMNPAGGHGQKMNINKVTK
jgi:hypothetical protein